MMTKSLKTSTGPTLQENCVRVAYQWGQAQ